MARSGLYRTALPVFLLCACTAAAAVWQSAAPAATEAPKAEDSRLNRSITLDLMRVPLSDLCQVMERRSGVVHRAADPATGDLLADVVGTLTVAQLHQALAEVLGVGWKRQGGGEAAGYVVERLPAKMTEAAREQAETDRAFGESLRRLLAEANLPEGAENQGPRNLRHLWWRPGRREALQVLGDLTPAEQAQVLAGGGVERAVASLSPQGQARVKQMTEEFRRDANQRADESLADPGGPKLRHWEPLDLENGEAWRIQIAPTMGWGPAGEALYMVRVFSPKEFGIGSGFMMPMAQPDRQDPARYRLPAAGPSAKETPSQPPLPDHSLSPGRSWEEIARDLARSLGQPIVSDAYRPTEHVFGSIDPALKEDSLESYLDRVCRFAFNRRWGRTGPVVLFQRCDWATQRRGQIPESQVRRWRRHIIDTGRVSFDHLIEMTALTPYQLPNLGDVIGGQADLVTQHQELLQLWKALPEAQRGALRGEGLVIRDMPLVVQPRAQALVSGILGSAAPLVLANAKLRVEQTEEAFTFSVLSPELPAVVRRVELTCASWFRELLRKDEAARVAALRAAGEAMNGSPPPAAGIGQ